MEWWAPKRGRPGRPRSFSDAAIPVCLGIEVLFGLALRQIEPGGATGWSPLARWNGGLLKMAGLEDWAVPDGSPGRLHAVPAAEDGEPPDPLPPRGRRSCFAGRQHRGEDARQW